MRRLLAGRHVSVAAGQFLAKYGSRSAKLYFEGHWGFQYYMEAGGAEAADFSSAVLRTRAIF